MPTAEGPPDPVGHRRGVFIGRRVERARLAEILDGNITGTPTPVALVTGPPGIGKTSLVEVAVADRLTVGDRLVLDGSGDELERDLDFGLVDQLLRRIPRREPMPARDAPAADVGAWLVRELDVVAGSRPVLVVVDDVQFVDPASLQVITFVARRLAEDRFAVLLASRPEGLGVLPTGLLRLVEATGGPIALDGLTVDEIRHMASAMQRILDNDTVTRIRTHTEGHPLHTRILLEQVPVETLSSTTDLDSVLPSLPRLVSDRLISCSDPARRLLDAIVILDEPAPISLTAAVAEVDDPSEAVEEITRLGLLSPSATGTGLQLRHRLIRSAILAALSPDQRRALHGNAARFTCGGTSLRHRAELSRGPDESLARDLLAQADTEANGGDRRRASTWCFMAADRSDGPMRERAVLRGMDHLLSTGLAPANRTELLDSLPPGPLREAMIGRSLLTEGRFEEAAVRLERAWNDRPADGGEELWHPVAEAMAVISLGSLDTDALIRWARQMDASGSSPLATTMLCHGLALQGDFAGAREIADDRIRERGDESSVFDARLGRALANLWSNDLDAARADLHAVLSGTVRTSLIHTITVRSHLADARFRAGLLSEAGDLADLAIELVEDSEAVWLMPLPHSIAAYVHTAAGDLDRARDHASAASTYAKLGGHVPAMLWTEAAWLGIAVAEGDHVATAAAGDRMLAGGLDRIPEGVNPWRADYVESLVETGRVADARRVLDGLRSASADHGDLRVLTGLRRAEAVVAAADGDLTRAVLALEAGLALDPVRSRPMDRARLERTGARILRLGGRHHRAGELLETASDRFRRCGASLWVRRCATEEAALQHLAPVRPRPVEVDRYALLSPRERMVSRLVADGLSNQQVAAELVLSVKTVEHHLTSIYAKLGVRSRTQMTKILASDRG